MTEQDHSETGSIPADKKHSLKNGPKRRLILFVFMLLVLLFFPFAHETWFRCAACSMSHSELRIVGILASSSEKETECSNWYRANVEPQHEHVWVRGPMGYGNSLYGFIMYGSSIYSPDGYCMPLFMSQSTSRVNGPIYWLSSDYLKIAMYQASSNPIHTRDLFLQLARFKPADTKEYKQQMEILKRLKDWSESGMKEPWPFDDEQKPAEK